MDVPAEYEWASVRQARRWVAERRLPFFRVDGRVYFDRDDIQNYVEDGRVEAVTR
jgi:hypothetical protein